MIPFSLFTDSSKHRSGWKGSHALRHHIYAILEAADLKDSAAFAYTHLMGRGKGLKGSNGDEASAGGRYSYSNSESGNNSSGRQGNEEAPISDGGGDGSGDSKDGNWERGSLEVVIPEH